MQKFIKELCLFFLLLFGLLISVGRFDNKDRCFSDNTNIKKLNCISSFDSLDILFLGNSYCYSGINPVYFDSAGIKTFNLGIATAGINFYNFLLTDYLGTAKQKPKTVFILLSPMTFSDKSDDPVNYPIYRYLKEPVTTENYILSADLSLVKKYPKILVKSFTKSCSNILSMVRSKKDFCVNGNNEMWLSKGFIKSEETYSLKKELKEEHLHLPLLQNDFDTVKVRKLSEIVSALQAANIKVVFFELPSNRLYNYFNPNYLSDYSDFVKSIKTNYTFIPASDSDLNETCFRDMDHLNSKGAAIVSKRMVNEIMTRKDLSELFIKR
ncbi:MAG: hypothetical protein IAF38_23025 [Bacteroidia bacterium]|nr:hypothetical protein [Bacteroidia bacterium]